MTEDQYADLPQVDQGEAAPVTTARTVEYHFLDGDAYWDQMLRPQGFIRLWIEAPYNWCAFHPAKMMIASYCEGDVSETVYTDMTELLKALQGTKDWWIEHLGERADPCLSGAAEHYGFLSRHRIDIAPPRTRCCGRLAYPTEDPGRFICLIHDL